MYIAAIWEIMTTSNHLVSPFFFYGGSNHSYNPYTFHLFYLHINHGTYTVYNGTLSITHYQSQLPIGYLPGLFSLFYRRMPYAPRISKIMVHIDLCNQGLILTQIITLILQMYAICIKSFQKQWVEIKDRTSDLYNQRLIQVRITFLLQLVALNIINFSLLQLHM